MSAALKATTALGGLAVLSAGAAYTLRTPATEFSNTALAAAEHGTSEISKAVLPKPRLPSTFFEFSVGEYKFSNARA